MVYKILIGILIALSGTQVQAKEDRTKIYNFLSHYECRNGPGQHLTAYPDYNGYSIGCGTPSRKGEKISMAVAWVRFYEYSDIRIDLVKRHFPNANENQITALASLAANNGTCYYYHLKHGLSEYQWRNNCDNVRIGGKLVELRGLHDRRGAEADLYFGKQ